MNTRSLKIVITISIALMFTFIAFNNISDYCTNFRFVRTVLNMESIKATDIQWRAITSPLLQQAFYLFIIIWEALTAIVCWGGAVMMFRNVSYNRGKMIATAGLTLGFSLFMIGFVIVAGEWFYLWDSLLNTMHSKAILLALFLGTFACFVSQKDDVEYFCAIPKD